VDELEFNLSSFNMMENNSFLKRHLKGTSLDEDELDSTTSSEAKSQALKKPRRYQSSNNQTNNPSIIGHGVTRMDSSDAPSSFDDRVHDADLLSREPSNFSPISGSCYFAMMPLELGKRSFSSRTPPDMLVLTVGDDSTSAMSIQGFSGTPVQSVESTLLLINAHANTFDVVASATCLVEHLKSLIEKLIDEDRLLEQNPDTRDKVVTTITALLQTRDREDILGLALVLGSRADFESHAMPIETIEAGVTAIRSHPDSRKLQAAGCQALATLAWWYSSANRTAIIAAGGIEAVLAAMRGHSDAEEIQKYGCLALGNLAANPKSIQRAFAGTSGIEGTSGIVRYNHMSNQTAIAGTNCIVAVVAAMRGHSDAEEMQ